MLFAMSSASTIRLQIESALSKRIPSALTPAPRILRPQASVGIASVDDLLVGGLPLGAITEMVGPECSGRASMALSFIMKNSECRTGLYLVVHFEATKWIAGDRRRVKSGTRDIQTLRQQLAEQAAGLSGSMLIRKPRTRRLAGLNSSLGDAANITTRS
jgi:hypothetical protein